MYKRQKSNRSRNIQRNTGSQQYTIEPPLHNSESNIPPFPVSWTINKFEYEMSSVIPASSAQQISLSPGWNLVSCDLKDSIHDDSKSSKYSIISISQ